MKTIEIKKCPACCGVARKKLFKIKYSNVYKCLQCGLRYLDPCLSSEAMSDAYKSDQTLQKFHNFYDGYYEYGDIDKPSKTRDDFENALKRLESLMNSEDSGQSKKVLDVGYGNGFFLGLARKRGWDVSGIDTSVHNQQMACKKFSLELTAGDFESDIPEQLQYGAISFWDLIEHFSTPQKVLAKTKRVLKSNGYVVVGVPNDRSFLRIAATWLYRMSLGVISGPLKKVYFLEHTAYYTLSSLEYLMHQNGFFLVDHFYSSTDLKKYHLSWMDQIIAQSVLFFGKLFGLQNRVVAIFKFIGDEDIQNR